MEWDMSVERRSRSGRQEDRVTSRATSEIMKLLLRSCDHRKSGSTMHMAEPPSHGHQFRSL